jgi:hypothetical protein
VSRSGSIPKPRAFRRVGTTIRDCAKLDFAPWSEDAPKDIDDILEDCVQPGRIALRVMQMTRDQLIRMHGEIGRDLSKAMLVDLDSCVARLRDITQAIECAHMRVFVTACAYEIDAGTYVPPEAP